MTGSGNIVILLHFFQEFGISGWLANLTIGYQPETFCFYILPVSFCFFIISKLNQLNEIEFN